MNQEDQLVLLLKYHYSLNDPAHNWTHVCNVRDSLEHYRHAAFLSQHDYELARVAVAFHDTGCHINREFHHVHSAHIFLGACEDLQLQISDEDKTIIINAILEHRASFKGVRKHIVSEVVALSDIGKLTADTIIKRMIAYRKGRFIRPGDLFEHFVEKFSEEGYLWKSIPALYFKVPGHQEECERIKELAKDFHAFNLFVRPYLLQLESDQPMS